MHYQKHTFSPYPGRWLSANGCAVPAAGSLKDLARRLMHCQGTALCVIIHCQPLHALLDDSVTRCAAEGTCMKEFTWNAGGVWQGRAWTPDLPTDAALLFYLFAAFLEAPRYAVFCCVCRSSQPVELSPLLMQQVDAETSSKASCWQSIETLHRLCGRWLFNDEEAAAVVAGPPLFLGTLPARQPEQFYALLPFRPASLAKVGTARTLADTLQCALTHVHGHAARAPAGALLRAAALLPPHAPRCSRPESGSTSLGPEFDSF